MRDRVPDRRRPEAPARVLPFTSAYAGSLPVPESSPLTRKASFPRVGVHLFDVLIPIIGPVRAEPGQRIVVRPGHPTRPVVVVTLDPEGDWQPICVGRWDPAVRAAIAALAAAGVIVPSRPIVS